MFYKFPKHEIKIQKKESLYSRNWKNSFIKKQSKLVSKKILFLHFDSKQCGSSSVGRVKASQALGREFEPRLPLSTTPKRVVFYYIVFRFLG